MSKEENREDLIKKLNDALEAVIEIMDAQLAVDEAEEKLKAVKLEVESTAWFSFGQHVLFILGYLVMAFFIMESPAGSWTGELASTVGFFLIVFGPAVVIHFIKKPMKAKKQEKAEELRIKIIPPAEEAVEKAKKNLQKVANNKKILANIAVVPERYANIDSLMFFIDAFENMRADTLKEAINLYEQEKINREQLELQMAQLTKLNEVAESNQQIVEKTQESIKLQEKTLKTQQKISERTKKISKQARFSNALGVVNTVKHWNDGKK